MKIHLRKILILTLLLACQFENLQACDICGCGVGNYYMGVMPLFSKNFVGVRYRQRTFTSGLVGTHSHAHTEETYQNAEVWGRFYPTKNLQIWAFVPYNFNLQQQEGKAAKNLFGIGDISVIANYQVINQKDSAGVWKHNLLIGGGLKLPTGNYQYEDNNTLGANANFQMGTGSLDVLLSIAYTIRYKKVGLSTTASYQITTQNKNKHQFGNRLNSLISGFYVQKLGKVAFMPNAGIYTEWAGKDSQNQEQITETGGCATFGNFGLDAYYKRFSLGFQYQTPISQNLAESTIKAHDRVTASFMVMF